MKWYKWANRNQISYINEPGIYYIAYSDKDISGDLFEYIKEIIYIGMSIAQKGANG